MNRSSFGTASITASIALACGLGLAACTTTAEDERAPAVSNFAVAHGTVKPGTSVARGGKLMQLARGSLELNQAMPAVELADADWRSYRFDADGQVKVVSIVPSVDTKVCEQQTHVLGETAKLDPKVGRVTLSRDLPAAQKRFAKEAKLTNVTYVSDYRDASFGKASGLLIEENGLLARAVLVVDGEGRVRYMQVVPDVAQLPDMDKAFEEANKLVQ